MDVFGRGDNTVILQNGYRKLLHVVYAVLPWLLLTLAGQQALALSAYADRTKLPLDETLRLEIRSSNSGDLEQIDLSALENDFEVINRSSQSNFSMVNGRTESMNTLVLKLSPRHLGQLSIPAFEHKGESSKAIEIIVEQPQPAPAALANQSVIIEAEVDKAEVMLGEQVLFTVRLISAIALSNQRIDSFNASTVDIVELEDQRYNRRLNGNNYQVTEKHYALFVNSTGEITIPSLTYSANLPSKNRSRFGFGFGSDPFARGERIKLATKPIQLTVKQPPASAMLDNNAWLPAEAVQLDEDWSDNIDQARVGEPITRSINILAKGLLAEALPEIPVTTDSNVNSYPEKPELLNQQWTGGIAGNRRQSHAIIPLEEGQITLPPVTLNWWNTTSNQIETAKLPARTITVMPAVSSAGDAVPLPPSLDTSTALPSPLNREAGATDTSGAGTTLLAWTSAMGWLLAFVLGFLLYRANITNSTIRQSAAAGNSTATNINGSVSIKQALSDLKKSCKQNDPQSSKTTLQLWLRLWQKKLQADNTLHSPTPAQVIEYLAEYCNGEGLSPAIAALDAALYSGTSDDERWSGEVLLNAITQIREQGSNNKTGLAPLYPG